MKVKEHLIQDPRYKVPTVIESVSTGKIITSTYEEGFTFDEVKQESVAQELKSRIG